MKTKLLVIAAVLFFSNGSFAQISITSSTFTYSQNFDGLANSGGPAYTWTDNSTIAGWYSNRTQYGVSTGSFTTPFLYSLGAAAASDRALGSMTSPTTTPIYYGVRFINNSGSTITQIPISYTGEQWKLGSDAGVQTITFAYQINASNLTSGTWTNVAALNFSSPNNSILGAQGDVLDGNASGNKTAISATITAISLVDGDEIWFRWQDNDDAGTTDKILAVDDFSFNQNGDPLPVELTSFSALLINKEVKLNWQTATEINNYGFEIERSENRSQKSEGNNTEQVWETIGFVEGNGNSNSPKEYSFTDASAMLSTSSSSSFGASKLIYRLKQIDTDGKYEYSNEIEVDFDGLPSQFSLEQNYPNPFNPSTKIKYVIPVVETGHAPSLRVALKIFDALGNEVATLVNEVKEPGFYEIDWNANGLSSGVYYYRLTASGGAGSFTQSKKLMLIK
ncbi:MAG: T9SS type A sorting domain-containing protein [Ignavibacteria bacterium]|nr:T9SS type A sorting domain-containing protein [Ignavibacteria bacterium]